MKTFKIVGDDISDGYHSFGELYDHRVALFVRLCLMYPPSRCAWKRDAQAPGWIILYCELGDDGQVSYHIPERWIDTLIKYQVRECPEYKWDGHSAYDVLHRLELV